MTEIPPPDLTLDQRRLLLEQVEGRLGFEFDAIDGIDRKATGLLAATLVVLGLVLSNVGDFAGSSNAVSLVFYGALVVLAVGLFAGVYSLWPRSFWAVPEPGPLLEQHATKTPEWTLGELLSTKAEAFRLNAQISKSKTGRLRAQMFLLAAGGGLLVVAYVLERVI